MTANVRERLLTREQIVRKPTVVTLSLSLSLLLMLPTNSAFGQQSDGIEIAHGEASGPYRSLYVRSSQIPDNVAFPPFVNHIVYAESDELRYINAVTVFEKLELESVDHGEEILSVLERINNDIGREKSIYFRQVLCPLDRPRPTGTDVYSKIQEVEEYDDALGTKYLGELRTQLDDVEYSNLLSWINEIKPGMKIARLDFARYHATRNPDTVRQEICGRFDARADADGRIAR